MIPCPSRTPSLQPKKSSGNFGFAERVVYREFFPRGLTALDDIDEATLGTRPSLDHVTAHEEVATLLRQLKLPLDERGRRRAANRAEWFNQVDKPLEVHDILGHEPTRGTALLQLVN